MTDAVNLMMMMIIIIVVVVIINNNNNELKCLSRGGFTYFLERLPV